VRAYAFSMDSLRTLRRSTEVMNLLVLSTFEALGVVVLVLGIIRSSAILVTLGVAYAGAMAWYLVHLLTRVASKLDFNLATAELNWSAPAGHGHFPLASLTSVRQTRQPDVFAFVLDGGTLIRFWHRNRFDAAQSFFRELRVHRPDVSFDALYLVSKASWRRGLAVVRDDVSSLTKPV